MRTKITLSAIAVMLSLVACNGPTKTGTEARNAARERMGKTSSIIVYDQARQSFEAGQFDRAMLQINEAIQRTPTEARYWILRGRIQLEQGRLEESLKDFQQAATLKPDNAESFYCQGIVHERWSREDDAIEAYRKAAELDSTKVSYLLACAEVLIAAKRYDDAEAVLTPKLDYFENNAPMHELLAQLAMLRADPKTAATHYNRAMLIDPTLPMVLDNLVRAQFAAEQWQECLTNVRRLQREAVGGRTSERLRVEGRCLAMLGRTADARTVFAELTRLEPDDVQAWVELAGVSWQMGEISRVRTAATRLLRIAPDRYEGYVFQGLVEEDGGNKEAAEQWFRKAAQIGGASADIALMLSGLHQNEPKTHAASVTTSDDGG